MNLFSKTTVFGFSMAVLGALQPTKAQPQQAASSSAVQKERMNAWALGLAGGQLEGAPIRFAAEIARVVDDGPNMLVLPIVTRGPVENMNALLNLRGVDTAIVNSDALE